MEFQNNVSLKIYNSFGIDVLAKEFVEITDSSQLDELYRKQKLSDIFIVSGGSNMLLTSDVDKLVVHINNKGRDFAIDNNGDVIAWANAGEDWPEFVNWTVENSFFGLENLTDIPGKVGSSPIQNIGAYGVELKDSFLKLIAFDTHEGNFVELNREQCNFAYRDSIFKGEAKGRYIICRVYFLLKKYAPLRLEYGAIKETLRLNGIEEPSLQQLSECISQIRSSKLPNPKEIGNSGSFFKNPVITMDLFRQLELEYHDIPHFILQDGSVKVPAGWLIDRAGWKGYRINDAGVHKNQALVLVNYGSASGVEILQLANQIQADIYQKFKIQLEMEVNVF